MIRIRYTGDVDNSPPIPVIKLKGGDYKYEVGEMLAFDGGESSDPDGDNLAFAWNFGDGTLSQEKEPTHSFQTTGKYQVELVVTDVDGLSQRTSMVINIGNPPTVSILSPLEGEKFEVGQLFQLKGEAFNFKGERLDDASLTWEVRKHHADHFHPFLDLTHGNDLELFPAPEPEDFFAATNSYLEIILKATDENGLTTQASRLLQPWKINVGIESNPPDIEVKVDDYPLRTSEQIVSWKKHNLNIVANDQPPLVFRRWWDGNTERERKITLQEDGQTILAIYCAIGGSSCSSDEQCCSGTCEMMACTSVASTSNDWKSEEGALYSDSNDATQHTYHDMRDVGVEEDSDGKQPSKTGIAAWMYDDSLAISDVFLATVVTGVNVILLLSIAICLLVKRKKKKALLDKVNDDISTDDGDDSNMDKHLQDEEEGLSELSQSKSRRIPNSPKNKQTRIGPPEKADQTVTAKAVHETGLDPQDIELVMSQAGCSRVKATKALMENDGDLVNSIMSVMY